MNSRTLVALVLALAVFVFFSAMQARFAPKRPARPAADSLHAGARAPGFVPAPGPGIAPAATGASSPPAPERLVTLETPRYRAQFSSLGARLLSVELKRFASAHGASDYATHPGARPKRGGEVPEGDRVRLAGEPSFALDLGTGAGRRSLAGLAYAVRESTAADGAVAAVTFEGTDSSGVSVRQTWRVRPDSYLLDLEVAVTGPVERARVTGVSLGIRSWPLVTESNPQNDLRSVRAISLVGKDLHRDAAAGMIGKDPRLHEGVAHWAGVQSHYFLGLVAAASGDGSAAVSSASTRHLEAAQLAHLPAGTKADEPVAEGTLEVPLPVSGTGVQRFVAYFGPADYFTLAKRTGSLEMERAVDLGWNWIVPVSKLLLRLLRAINSLVHNFGVTIFLLATLVRLALHPLNMSSMKSMRAMQRLQPEIEALRERFKNDASTMNTKMMELYKANNVNPAGGCLPMLLQMPLFFALYAVIFNAIDLRQAPLGGWIHDLSAPDMLTSVAGFPIRLLPVLMAGTGLLSQLFSPTDPRQAPTMYMMNVVMLGIFYNLPSGLVFYWTVMNLLTALQQWLAMRGDGGSVAVVVPEKPGAGRRK